MTDSRDTSAGDPPAETPAPAPNANPTPDPPAAGAKPPVDDEDGGLEGGGSEDDKRTPTVDSVPGGYEAYFSDEPEERASGRNPDEAIAKLRAGDLLPARSAK